jgi:hypothetical protein
MAKLAGSKRPKLVLVSEETSHLSLLLAQELLRWPDVTARPMFGLRAFYRKTVIFAMLPDKRALENPKAIAYKLGDKWQPFELNDQHDIDEALARLNQAYSKAARRTR